ncbi:MAG: lipoprotein [Mycobacterium sp.]|nr:lipoprotein [Mycobacterium sp.]
MTVTVARMRRPVLALAIAVTAVAVSACGSSGPSNNGEAKKSGPQVVKDASTALAAAGAVHFAGTITDSDTKTKTKVDMQLQSDGTSGSLTSAGYQIDLIAINGVTYEKAPAAFYTSQKAPAAAAAALGGHWVKLSGSDSDSDFTQFTLAGVAKSLTDPTQNSSPTEQKVTTGTLDGQKVVIVRQADGSQLFIAATGAPLPLKVVNSDKSQDGSGTLILSGYGKHQVIKAPAGAIDASTVAGGSSAPA